MKHCRWSSKHYTNTGDVVCSAQRGGQSWKEKQTKRESHNEEVKDKEAGQLGNNDGEGLGQFS